MKIMLPLIRQVFTSIIMQRSSLICAITVKRVIHAVSICDAMFRLVTVVVRQLERSSFVICASVDSPQPNICKFISDRMRIERLIVNFARSSSIRSQSLPIMPSAIQMKDHICAQNVVCDSCEMIIWLFICVDTKGRSHTSAGIAIRDSHGPPI